MIKELIHAVVVVNINKYPKYFQPPASFAKTIDAAKQGI
jgi:hypothetical protein